MACNQFEIGVNYCKVKLFSAYNNDQQKPTKFAFFRKLNALFLCRPLGEFQHLSIARSNKNIRSCETRLIHRNHGITASFDANATGNRKCFLIIHEHQSQFSS